MSYEDRSIDKKAILALQDGQKYYFNMFQDGGAMVQKDIDRDGWHDLYEIPLYGGKARFEREFHSEQIDEILNEVYETWI